MPSSKTINWTILIAFLALNLVGFGLSHQRRKAEAATQRWLMELKGRQGDTLARWHEADVVAIDSSQCKAAIRQLPVSHGVSDSEEASAATESLSAQQIAKLTQAIHGLASAYRQGTPTALIKYMKQREETLDPTDVGKLTNYLVEKHGLEKAELERLSLEQQFMTFWDVYGITPEWKSLVPRESSIHVWSCHADVSETVSEPSQLDGDTTELWQRRGIRHHQFENTVDDVVTNFEMHSEVTVADVRLVVQHTGEGVHTICPYTVRFWYSQQRQDWVPHLMLQFRTSRDIPDEILF